MKHFLIAYSHDVKPKYMWQSDENRTDTVLIDQFSPPTIARAKFFVKSQNMNVTFKNLKIVAISDLGASRVEMPTKDTINTLNNFQMENTLGYDELVDTAADVVELTVKVVDAVKDGIQLNDAFLLLAEAKNIEEIVKDAPQALAELKDLTAEEATQASEALALRLNASPGSVIDIVEQSINLLTRGYVYFSDVVLFAKQFKKETA